MCQYCFEAVLARLEAGEVLDFSHLARDPALSVPAGGTKEQEVIVAKRTPPGDELQEQEFSETTHCSTTDS